MLSLTAARSALEAATRAGNPRRSGPPQRIGNGFPINCRSRFFPMFSSTLVTPSDCHRPTRHPTRR